MLPFILGLAIGIGVCEFVGRKLDGYSVVMEAVDWMKRLG